MGVKSLLLSTKTDTKNLDIGYKYHESVKHDPDEEFNIKITNELESKGVYQTNDKPNNCIIEIFSKKSFSNCWITNLISPLTLMIVPYYCKDIFEVNASIISTKDNKVLKEYYLKDEAHEIWSVLWLLGFAVSSKAREILSPEGATYAMGEKNSQPQ